MTKTIFVAASLGFIAGVAISKLGAEPVEVHRMKNGVTCKTHQSQAWLVCRDEERGPGWIGLMWTQPGPGYDLDPDCDWRSPACRGDTP
jgi:hypothetical protein